MSVLLEKATGKIITAGTKVLVATWWKGHLKVVNSANGTILYDNVVYTDVVEIIDVTIAADGTADFLVRLVDNKFIPTNYKSDEPKIKYGFETKVSTIQHRRAASFVTI